MRRFRNLDELIDELCAIRDERGRTVTVTVEGEDERRESGEDIGIRIGDQPNYPFECSVGGVIFDATIGEHGAVVILEGRQLGYGKRDWWNGEDIEREEEDYDDTPERSAVREYPAMDDPREG